MNPTKVNIPIDQLTDDQLIDLIVVLGAFSHLCTSKQKKKNKVSFGIFLLYCLKLFDMNLLHIKRSKKDNYSVKTTKIPPSIIQHMLSIDDKFLPKKVIKLVTQFVKFVKVQNIYDHKKSKLK
jgi:hypothetical protein